ncbi:MAG: ATP-grasp domain-containing protein, partial [Anaerolineae bacterium]|nr:ATP-grasp domain-containing protein [Anaerolineae bacterium]
MAKEKHGERVLLLATAQSYRIAAFEAAAERLGVEVLRGRDVPLPMMEDLEASGELLLDYRDLEESSKKVEKFAGEEGLGAILGLDDSGTLLAARASERLGLAHNAVASALAARNKHVMRQKFAEGGAPSPKFRYCRVDEDVEVITAEVNYPCVVKPVTLSGSRGVMRADDPDELVRQIGRLKQILGRERCEEYLVEDYIAGTEVALEGLMDDGELQVLALFDKPDPLEGPFF